MATTILFGNGLNRLSNAPSWDDIMKLLDPSWSAKGISSWNVPNTIQYDQLELQSSIPQSILLKHLYAIVGQTWNNSIYQALALRRDTNFITTNYDFSLELAISPNFQIARAKSNSILEKLYNVNTYYAPATNVKIWHIHGDAHRPQSIILGYDHYCKQIAKIDRNLPPKYKGYNNSSSQKNSREGKLPETWATLFFTDDIYILGLGLGFAELDLWWLIDKWANYQKFRAIQGLPKSNKIVYMDTDIVAHKMCKQEWLYKQNFICVLKDYGIDYRPYPAPTRLAAYTHCINAIP